MSCLNCEGLSIESHTSFMFGALRNAFKSFFHLVCFASLICLQTLSIGRAECIVIRVFHMDMFVPKL